MTGCAGTAESAVMTVRTGMAPETCNSSPGNANLRIGTQAGQNEDSHSDSQRSDALRHTPSTSPTHGTVISPFRRHVHPPGVIPAFSRHTCLPPASLLLSPVIPASPRRHSCFFPSYLPPPSVIPAQAGILTRGAIYKGHAVAVNYAGKSFIVRIILCLYVLKPLVWIRAVCKSRRPYPD